TITGNKVLNNRTGSPIAMKGSSNHWLIAGNSFAENSNNSPAPVSVESTVINNNGYNPVGIIARVKMRKPRNEHMSAGLPPIADLAQRGQHGRKVPFGDLSRCSEAFRLFDHLISVGE